MAELTPQHAGESASQKELKYLLQKTCGCGRAVGLTALWFSLAENVKKYKDEEFNFIPTEGARSYKIARGEGRRWLSSIKSECGINMPDTINEKIERLEFLDALNEIFDLLGDCAGRFSIY